MFKKKWHNKTLQFLCFGIFALLLIAPVNSQNKFVSKKLTVGVAGSPPFVIQKDSSYQGIAVEVWQEMAANWEREYTFKPYESVPEGIEALKNGKLDILVGPASITLQRAQTLKFTYPYYVSRLSILSKIKEPGIWDRIASIFSIKLLASIGVLVLVLGMVGLLLWLAERKHNPEQFPDRPGRGIANGMWCAIVTMSTTGYGDRAPLTFWGRIVAGAWMVISIIFATTLVAGIASTLTLSGMGSSTIDTVEELNDKKVAVIKDSPGIELAENYGAKTIKVEDLEKGYQLLKKDQVDAVIYDRPQLLYLVKQKHDQEVAVSKSSYKPKGYGFVLPLNSPITHKVNLELLQLKETGYLARILSYWLGETH